MQPITVDAHVQAVAAERPLAVGLADAPNRPAFFGGEPKRLTWAEVDNAVTAVAADLQSLGAGPGRPVAIQLPNVSELVLTILACFRLGVTAVPFPVQHRRHELRHGLGLTAPAVFVTAVRPDRPDQLHEIQSVIDEHGGGVTLAVCGDTANGNLPDGPADEGTHTLRFDTAPSAEVGPIAPTGAADDVVTVCWTSGTTGTPKGVPRTNAMWLASGGFQVDQLQLAPDDRLLCPFPVVNMAGIGGMVLPWVLSGSALHLHQPLDLPVFLQQVAGERITYTVAPPPLLNRLLADESLLDGVDLSSLRRIASGSAPLDPAMVEGWQRRGIEIVNIFGSNEGASLVSTQARIPDPAQRARFFPRPDRPGLTTRLVDLETGKNITTANHLGELRFRGTTVFHGYLESDGAEFDELGYYRTGDLFEWVDEPPTMLRFVDRAKDIVIRGGMNISAVEVEGLLASHPSVAECAAVGYPDADLGERLGVFVVAAPGATPSLDELVEHLRRQGVASYKLPERLEVIEVLPRNPVGKVVKPDLRLVWASR